MPLRINVQKKANGAADVLIETEIDPNKDYGHKIFIKDGFSIGYNGEGARGLLNLFKMLGADNSELESFLIINFFWFLLASKFVCVMMLPCRVLYYFFSFQLKM